MKLKLIDVLNKIANNDIKIGTTLIFRGLCFIYSEEGFNCGVDKYHLTELYRIDMLLNEPVELIEDI